MVKHLIIKLKEKKMELKIVATCTTPLLQIENSDTFNGVPKVFCKKKECIEDGKIGSYPYYSGNGWRGLLHREIGDLVMMKALEKGIKLDATNVHILLAGGGSNFQEQPINIANKVRELNPIASVFGVSLAIEGKLMITDLEPTNKMWRNSATGDTMYSGLVRTKTYVKKDDILSATKYARILSEEDILAWQEDNQDVQEQRSDERGEEGKLKSKTKKLSIQAYNALEYIVPGTQLVGYIGAKYPLTDIEKGMLLVGVERMLQKQIGSTTSRGFGVMEYSIQREDESSMLEIMSASKNSNNIYKPISEIKLDKNDIACKEAFYAWLENIGEENILLSKTLFVKKDKEDKKK